jgi:predicted aldo/keto reductase-like oxidoreductase
MKRTMEEQMLYRRIGTTGVEASILGFGCMRLPVIGGKPQDIDREAATAMLHRAIEGGVNYVDTAWFYHAEQFGQPGQSEPFVGEALAGGWRDRVHLATKLPQQLLKSRDEMDRFLEKQLKRLQTDHIDFYLVHGVTGETWDKAAGLGVLEFLDSARADGRIKHPAFSYHGKAADFSRVVDAYDWAFAQIQYNYMDIDYQAGHAGLQYAASKGVGVVVMEPLKGGKLAMNLPPQVSDVFGGAEVKRTAAEWALRYVWNEPGVSLALSGMSTMDQVDDNLAIAEHGEIGSLDATEMAMFAEARRVMKSKIKADCTACRYCQPCPSGIEIPDVLACLNASAVWDDPNPWLAGYTGVKVGASECSECGQCEDMCPQGLPIRDLMKETAALFGR